MATINDVAKHAGVSIKSVSRVLNNEPHVRAELREKVESAVAALNYRPNQAARRLAGRRSFLVAYLYDNPNAAYVSQIQAGAARRCRELGCHLVVEPLHSHSRTMIDVVERLMATLSPDGVVLTPPLSDNVELLATLKRHNAKIVRIAAADKNFGIRVHMDERQAARCATEHLIALGHRQIGMVRGHPEHAAAAKRFDGYLDALMGAGLRLDNQYVAQGYFDIQSGIEAGRTLLALRKPPTAIFAANDEMALGVMIAARDAGLDVPHDLSIAGFDDTPMSRHIWPSLTTIRQPLEEMGWSAVEALLSADARRTDIQLAFELEARASTAAPQKRKPASETETPRKPPQRRK